MATKKSQRIVIFIIAIVLVVGTLGSFLVMILSTKDQQDTAQQYQQAMSVYERERKSYQALVDARDAKLSEKYYPTFKEYASLPAKYAIDSVKSLTTRDLKEGTGPAIDDSTKFAAYYIGWNPDGKIFDQSVKDGRLGSPFAIDGLKDTSVIDGWKEGLVGMKIGGVRLLEVPSDKAYKETGQGDDIPPNTPIKFVVMAIDTPAEVPEPEALTKAYSEYQQALIKAYGQQ